MASGGGIPAPSSGVLIALASVAVHAEELLSPGGHEADRHAIRGALSMPGVREYMTQLDALALLPVRRDCG